MLDLDFFLKDYYSNRTIMCTSLQNIVTTYDKTKAKEDIQQLFKRRHYPRFQLQEFCRHRLYHQDEKFRYFIDNLEEWNRKIDRNQISNTSDTLFRKNVFIFNTLRNALVQQNPILGKNLDQLYDWHKSLCNKNIKIVTKKIVENSQYDEDWNIRNTFKSNLPAEINLYRRQAIFLIEQDKDKLGQVPLGKKLCLTKEYRKIKTQANYDDQGQFQFEENKILKIQNSITQFQRQCQELINVRNRLKIKKQRQQQYMVKNYEMAEFCSQKILYPPKNNLLKKSENAADDILFKQQRVKTSFGERFSKRQNSLKRFSQQEKFVEFPARRSELVINEVNKGNKQEKRLSEIVGLRLFQNPFETKLKKKKRVI